MSELNLEAIRRKAQNAITATDKEWARIAYFLLNRIEDHEDEIFYLEQENALNLETIDRLYYGGCRIMAELDTDAIYTRLLRASGDGKWEKTLYSPRMSGMDDYRIYAVGQPGIKAYLICSMADAEFIEHAKEDIESLLNRVSELEAELERTYEKIDEQGFSSILMDDPWPGEEYSSF